MTNKTITNDTRKLSEIEGTVTYAIVNNQEFINNVCMSNKPLDVVKTELISFILTNSEGCEIIKEESKEYLKMSDSIRKIVHTLKNSKSKYDILLYLYNIALAGDNLGVIAV